MVAVLVAASCSTPPGTPAPNYGFKFRASKVTVTWRCDGRHALLLVVVVAAVEVLLELVVANAVPAVPQLVV